MRDDDVVVVPLSEIKSQFCQRKMKKRQNDR